MNRASHRKNTVSVRQLSTTNAIRLTKVIDDNNTRSESPEMCRAIYDEVQDLIRRGAFKVILRCELPDGANSLTARFSSRSNHEWAEQLDTRYDT